MEVENVIESPRTYMVSSHPMLIVFVYVSVDEYEILTDFSVELQMFIVSVLSSRCIAPNSVDVKSVYGVSGIHVSVCG
jgi:hypothetical protein